VADYSAGMTAAGAGTSVRPILAIQGSSTVSGFLTGFWLFNTTAVACTYRLVRYTAGTAGAGITETKNRVTAPAATLTVTQLHTADVTVTEDLGYRASVAGAIGAGAFIPVRAPGIETPTAGTTPGIGLVAVGTGQVCEVGFAWSE
jgi:hypothetical protein